MNTGTIPTSDRKGRGRPRFDNLLLHFRPRTVPAPVLRFTFTWGLGGMAFVLVILLAVTGILLKFAYLPFPGKAYESVRALQGGVPFGRLVRNVHHWSANLLVVTAFLHMMRVFLTGGYQQPRRLNWYIGLALLLVLLAANFTGYLLPWDQLAYWATTICVNMVGYLPAWGDRLQAWIRGGPEIGAPTLSNFFVLHTAILPLCLILLLPWHFWRIRKAGGLVLPRAAGQPRPVPALRLPSIPDLMLRELVVALVLVASVLLFSVFFEAPLGDPANPGLSPNPTKAPWYFMAVQEMLLHVHPLFAVFVLPLLAALGLLLLPFVRPTEGESGVWFLSRKGRRTALLASLTSLVAVPVYVVADERFIDFTAWMPGLPPVVANGLIPTLLLLSVLAGFLLLVKRGFRASNTEAVQAVLILVVTAAVVLTVVGVWFRGEGMSLAWPWKGPVSPP